MAKGKFFTKKQVFHAVYSIGASIVILGAMFKSCTWDLALLPETHY